jgi:CheY-like chemotaxis protein
LLPTQVLGDPARLRQILLNLAGNAIKFTDGGSVAITCHIDAGAGPALLHFVVRDSGIGIAADKVDHIFDAFAQADGSTARRFGGTGLGLTITRRLVELMAGRIWVHSVAGQGSEFHFTVPCQADIGADASSPADAHGAPAAIIAPVQSCASILLVEDNPINQRLAMKLLERRGYGVVLAENGHQALEKIGEGSFDLILMDMQMPEMDGIEATQAIRALETMMQRKRIPIVAMTANAMKGDRERCLQAGMDDYLPKPIKAAELLALLEQMLSPHPHPHPQHDAVAA